MLHGETCNLGQSLALGPISPHHTYYKNWMNLDAHRNCDPKNYNGKTKEKFKRPIFYDNFDIMEDVLRNYILKEVKTRKNKIFLILIGDEQRKIFDPT